ncbi:unnamed protein product [Rhizoctonia solani]|uniref:Laminin domain protein n=1 Tax=Rhizoctonia solani TaxID=456999 RepID=A0A8H3AGS8_9AGAM|nr:unnamed protein product [Rhizoctonia solani]CAE6483246.1 unnamed protein product [Rhizoctonia solani]
MTTMRVSHSGETVLIPPQLPGYLSDTHTLNRIVGKPTDDDVKAIHSVIRTQNTMAHLPTFYNPDLSMQLSQHLFGAQLAIYRVNYSMALLPGERSVYTPPTLPSHVPGTLSEVVGVPSNEEIKLVQGALRGVENLANSPRLFDPDLSMKLSQHMFNLQFARYMHDSSEGNFVSETEREAPNPAVPQGSHISEIANARGEGQDAPQGPSELAQLGETMKDVREIMKDIQETMKTTQNTTIESKDVLSTMSRMLKLIQGHQSSVAGMYNCYHIYKNPVNQEGVSALEYGLPQLRYGFYTDGLKYAIHHCDDIMARYLKFFGLGPDLVEEGEQPKLIQGKYGDAERLLLEAIGVGPYY